jgi:uncharacterized protein DUF6268
MRATRWIVPTLAASVLLGGTAFGQTEEDFELKLFRPRLEISADTYPSRSFEDDTGEYGSHSGRVNVTLPLGSTHLRPNRTILAYQFLAQANFTGASPDINLAPPIEDHRLYTGALSFTSVMLGRSKNLYLVSLGATAAEDQDTVKSPNERFYGAALATHRFKGKSTLIYGGAFVYTFGRGLAVPIIGGMWRLNPKWSLTAMAPFNIAATYKATDRVAVRLRTGPAGNRFRFSNDNQAEFPGEPETVYLRIVQWRTTGEIEWKVSDDVILLAQAGTARTLRFEIADNSRGTDPFLDEKTGSAPYLKVAARFLFGKSILEEWKD